MNLSEKNKKNIRGTKKTVLPDSQTILSKNSQREIIVIFTLAVFFMAIIAKINFGEVDGFKAAVLSDSLFSEQAMEYPEDEIVSGTGTSFAITKGSYLNIKLESSDSVKVSMESIPETVNIHIAPDASVPYASITLSGFLPSMKYYKYEDGYVKREEFTADENGKYSYIQDLLEPHRVFIQPRSSTKIIDIYGNGGDCALIGVWDNVSKTCTLTRDVTETIQLLNQNLTLDGAGFSVKGQGSGSGIYMGGAGSVRTVKNISVSNFTYGVYLDFSGQNIIKNVSVSGSGIGIKVDETGGALLESNFIINNPTGIHSQRSSNNIYKNNTIKSSSNVAAYLSLDANNTFVGNTISENYWGIYNVSSSGNIYDGNTFNNNSMAGISLIFQNSTGNKIFNNTIKSNMIGLRLQSSQGNTIYNNYFSNSMNVYFTAGAPINANNFNTVKTEGVNIVGGKNIGGNFWADYSGTGFSESCPDSDSDGICEDAYVLSPQNMDNLPLSKPDSIPPETTINFSGTLGENSWYVSGVEFTLAASDNAGGSGVGGSEYSYDNANWLSYIVPVALSGDGEKTIYYRSTDNAGNVETLKSKMIKIDRTLPVASGIVMGQPNSKNWYNTDVEIKFNCADGVSGPKESSFNIFASAEGANQSISGTCYDLAGNSAEGFVSGVNIDKTAPKISGAPLISANENNWYNNNVIVHFTASDGISGVDTVTNDVAISQEGNNQSAYGIATDQAGNSATAAVSGINIDKTLPMITGAALNSPNSNGWYKENAVIHYNASDNLSGIGSVSPDAIISAEGASQSATGKAVDRAGNEAVFVFSGINIDKTLPLITGAPLVPPNENGWYNSSVEIAFSSSDSLSGPDFTSGNILIEQEGFGQSATGKVVDKAGNESSYAVSDINIDKTFPVSEIVITAASGADCYSSDAVIKITASDALSGVSDIFYNLDNSDWKTYSEILTVASEGAHSVEYRSVDKAFNSEIPQTIGFIINKIAPEAAIKFDPDAKDIKVFDKSTGLEAGFTILSKNKKDKDEDKDEKDDEENGWVARKYVIQNCGKQSLSMIARHKKEGKEAEFEVVSLEYGGQKIKNIPENEIKAEYSLNKNSSIKELNQKLEATAAGKTSDIEAKYDSKDNHTRITIKEKKSTRKETKDGMVILGLETNNGDLTYKY